MRNPLEFLDETYPQKLEEYSYDWVWSIRVTERQTGDGIYTVFRKKTSASIIYYIFAKLRTIFIKIAEPVYSQCAFLYSHKLLHHKFLANNSLISTLNRMGHKSQYRTNSQTGKLYLRMMQSSCLQSLCGHVHSLCSKCSPLAATQACNLLRHSLTVLSITCWSRPSHSSWMRWRSSSTSLISLL